MPGDGKRHEIIDDSPLRDFGEPVILTAAAADVVLTPLLPDFRLTLSEYFEA